ncbi:hypothetical protein E4Z66_18965 [Aliishimia ponticola]|uniref:Uncharacterized protein n=1 Tax=Aliishimia ponticola TaxID=2499833 RepID=A0A4S4N8H8_9RHOB|nr:hypothetical protein [Aliishimia ponticola]THH34281.1 hypothetical protein E4Z66_18965 [Aliishimia ponticola]
MTLRHDLDDIALQASLELGHLQELLRHARDRLTFSTRNSFDRLFRETREHGLFAPATLQHANEIQDRLLRDIDSVGGAPLPARSDEGDLIWLGGTELSREYSDIERSLDRYIANAAWVNHALETEAALSRRRDQLATG